MAWEKIKKKKIHFGKLGTSAQEEMFPASYL